MDDPQLKADQIATRLAKSAEDLNRKIAGLMQSMPDDGTALLTDELSLQRALAMRAEVARQFGAYTGDANAMLTTYFTQSAKDSAAYLTSIGVDAAFTQSDADLVDAMLTSARAEIASASMASQAKIAELIYVGAVTGANKADLLQNIQQLLIGQTDKRGMPMTIHAQTIARTGYMEVDALVQKKKAKEAGLDKFKYLGGTVRDSRKWCVDHVNKTFTRAEIEQWEQSQWQGKKNGDPFVVRGGWNCLHHFRAVLDTVDEGSIVPQKKKQKAVAPVGFNGSGIKYTKTTQAEVEKSLSGFDPRIMELANAHRKPLEVIGTGHGKYSSRYRTINASNIATNPTTMRHEYGHHLDFEMSDVKVSGTMKFFGLSEKDAGFMSAYDEDAKALKLFGRGKADGQKAVLDQLYDKTVVTSKYGNYEVTKYVLKNKDWGGISDIADSLCRGELQKGRDGVFGHGTAYFKRYEGFKYLEVFANMAELRGTEHWAVVEKLFPNLSARFDVLIDEGVKNVRSGTI